MIDRRREDARKRAIALSESVCPDRPAAIEKPALPAVHTERAALSSSRGATADVVAIARASTKAAALDRQYQKVLHDSCPTSSTGRSSASSERTRRHEATGAFASRGPASRSAETCKADSCWRGRASGDGSFTAGSRMGASSRGSGSRRGMGRGGIGAQSDRYRPGPSGQTDRDKEASPGIETKSKKRGRRKRGGKRSGPGEGKARLADPGWQ